MNPTEKLVEDLMSILTSYEEKTGVYVQRINIDHVSEGELKEVRDRQRIIEIKLEME
ncbi:MAG: hypothetical protein JRI72_15035 [Deltaproteobacteria bacterium]|nr:hypothetical protein [Deltaproteobacteria bacterium]